MDKFEPHHIARLLRKLNKFRLLTPAVATKVQNRCLELLDRTDLRLTNVVHLMHGLSKTATPEERSKFEKALYVRMDDVDLVTLVELAGFLSTDTEHHDIIQLYNQQLLKHSHKIHMVSQSALRPITLLLARVPKQFNSDLQDALIDGILNDSIPWLNACPAIFSLLFCVSSSALPRELFGKILGAIPMLSMANLMRAYIDLCSAHVERNSPLNTQLKKCQYEIESRLVKVCNI